MMGLSLGSRLSALDIVLTGKCIGCVWAVTVKRLGQRNYDLSAVNHHAVVEEDNRTPEELLDEIEARGREVQKALAELRQLLMPR